MSSGPSRETLEFGGARYEVHADGILLQVLADGTSGPAVGRVDCSGSVTLDEQSAAGEWVGELLTATLPRRPADAIDVPEHVIAAIRRGETAEWRGALDAASLAACRCSVERLMEEGRLRRSNHGQAASIRGDRVAFLRLGTGGACDDADAHHSHAKVDVPDNDGDDSDDDDDDDGDGGERCPPALRRAFALLEQAGAKLEDALGCGPLLVPSLGMVAAYDDGQYGYTRHLDNERIIERGVRDEGGGGPPSASEWRNYRVLTAICYLNAAEWSDGGTLRCFEGASEKPTMEVEPVGGTVVFFPSLTTPHEVAPATRPRYAATLWFVSSSLLPGTPEERAAAAGAAAVAARRKRPALAPAPELMAKGGCERVVRKKRHPATAPQGESSSCMPPSPTQTHAQHTAALAASWATTAEAAGDGGGFSFGF